MKFNEKLIELRKKEGLSQEELGYKLNVTRQTVSKWELGQTTPEMDKLVEMSKIFNISIDELINESETSTNVNPIIEDEPINKQNTKEKNTKRILIAVLVVVLIIIVGNTISSISKVNSTIEAEKGIVGRVLGLFDRFFDLADEKIDEMNETDKKMEDAQDKIWNMIDNNMEEFNETESKIDKSAFNGFLEIHNGNNNGTHTKGIIDDVVTSNKTKERKITVKYNEIETQLPEQIQDLKTNIKEDYNYEISFDYDEDGYINKMTIKRVVSEFEISSFNNSFELFAGTNKGIHVISIIDKIITSNKTEERKITVKYGQTETQNEDEIKNIKRNIGNFDNCEVTYEYDADGFINKAIIEKI